MSKDSKIEWCHHTFNPWWGCIEVSPACDNCYARTFATRTGHKVWGAAGETDRRFFADKHWAEPLKWHQTARDAGERHRVFCASMADVFEQNEALDPHRERLWRTIELTTSLDWLLLTKRPQNIRRMVPPSWLENPRHNVWYGTTVENQHYADQRIPILLDVPAAVRFLSMEPLLGPVNLLNDAQIVGNTLDAGTPSYWLTGRPGWGVSNPTTNTRPLEIGGRIDWVITGGESGHGARPAPPDWYRSLRDQCITAGVAFHFKQWGEHGPDLIRIGKKAAGRELDGRTWDQFPTSTASAPVAAGGDHHGS